MRTLEVPAHSLLAYLRAHHGFLFLSVFHRFLCMPPSRLLKCYTSFSAFFNDMITNIMLRPDTQAGKTPWDKFIITLFKAIACSVQRSKEKKRKWRTIFTLFTLIKSTHLHEHICHLCMVLLRLERRKACPRRVFYTTCTSYECLAHRVNPTYYRSLRLSDSYISAWRYASCCRIAKKGTSALPYPARGAGLKKIELFSMANFENAKKFDENLLN